jgi:hypothetical protein
MKPTFGEIDMSFAAEEILASSVGDRVLTAFLVLAGLVVVVALGIAVLWIIENFSRQIGVGICLLGGVAGVVYFLAVGNGMVGALGGGLLIAGLLQAIM